MPAVGRRRRKDLDLPPRMFRRWNRYYYGWRKGIPLGPDLKAALHKYAELETGKPQGGTFAEVVAKFLLSDWFTAKARKTQIEYQRQAQKLAQVFGAMRLEQIKPRHVGDYLDLRPPIAGTRDKALLSRIFNLARRKLGSEAPNPCIGIQGTRAQRARYVSDAELRDAMSRADAVLAGFLELCYLTAQRPSDVLKMRRADVQDGALWVQQAKTGAKVRIEVMGPLEALLARLSAGPVASVFLIHDARGQRVGLQALQRRFRLLKMGWQIRDLRGKAATDARNSREAQALLGHAAATTTDRYIRRIAGERVQPITREIK